MSFDDILTYVQTNGLAVATKILAAIAFWVIGRWVIGIVAGFTEKAIGRNKRVDPTLARYATSILKAVMTIALAVGIIDYIGVETTSFAALLAGAGLAIGTAWGGLMQHFAAGAFLQMLRPFKVGDYVVAGGVEGTVTEVGLFGTTIVTPDNVVTTIGNNTAFTSPIKNFSVLEYRRVDAVAKVDNTVNPADAIERLRPVVAAIPNVMSSPAPTIEILEFTPEGPKLCVRPYCHTKDYWQVWFDTNRRIAETFAAAGYATPSTPMVHKSA